MLSNTLAELLRLPANQRVEIAMALWESLTEAEREVELALTPEQEAELDRRLAEHVANPGSAIPWDEVRRKLAGGARRPALSFGRKPSPNSSTPASGTTTNNPVSDNRLRPRSTEC